MCDEDFVYVCNYKNQVDNTKTVVVISICLKIFYSKDEIELEKY